MEARRRKASALRLRHFHVDEHEVVNGGIIERLKGVMMSGMAEYGEWNRKGAVLSDVTAQKEYGEPAISS